MAEDEIKFGGLTFSRGRPVELAEISIEQVTQLTERHTELLNQVKSTVQAYIKAVEELLEGKYAHLVASVPIHLRTLGSVLVICCEDGVIVRYERKREGRELLVGWSMENFAALVPKISENVIHCYADKDFSSTVPTSGVELELSATDPVSGKSSTLFLTKIGIDIVLEKPKELPAPPNKPYCIVSAQSLIEYNMFGQHSEENPDYAKGKSFVTRTLINLPVGWECIEIFPFFNLDHWRPKFAQVWAVNDILGSVVAQQFRDKQFGELDPKAVTRKQFSRLLKEYKDLLDSNPKREGILQSFLEKNPSLLSPTYTDIWPQLSLGDKRTDFVFKEATGDYLLVEIEKSTARLFLKDGDTSKELKHAQNQIIDWHRYLEDNLSTAQRELGLTGISTNPKSLIVIGRSNSLSDKNRRKLTTIENTTPRTKIITYDVVFESALAVIQNLLGPLWIEVEGTEVYYLPNK